jgi:RNAse (barnase) inhibitor barstar
MHPMPDPRALLESPDPIHLLSQEDADAIIVPLQHDPGGIAVRVIRGWKCRTADAMHDEIAAALQFPAYYGENWHALHDCLLDLAWLPADAYLLHLSRVQDVLPEDAEWFEGLLRVLLHAARLWDDPVGRGRGSLAPELQTRRLFRTLVSGNTEGLERARSVLRSLMERGE